MIALLIRKWFFETWDNLGYHILSSLLLVGLAILPFLTPFLFPSIGFWFLALVFLAAFPYFFVTALVSKRALGFANFQSPPLKEFFADWKDALRLALFCAAFSVLLALIIYIVLPHYLASNDLGSYVALGLLLWSSIVGFIILNFLFPVYWRLDKKLFAALRRTVLLVADNPFYTLLASLVGILLFVLSAITAFLIPGLASVSLWYHNALRLRLYKYVYLEENPDSPRNKIPWDKLLAEDEERVGSRSLRNFIFPWK